MERDVQACASTALVHGGVHGAASSPSCIQGPARPALGGDMSLRRTGVWLTHSQQCAFVAPGEQKAAPGNARIVLPFAVGDPCRSVALKAHHGLWSGFAFGPARSAGRSTSG
eukprot:7609664-Alexandrium_andersonii.AAC.1